MRELVDIGPCSGPRGFRSDRGDDLAIVNLGHLADCGNDWNGRLAAAGHHIDILGIQVVLAVNDGNDVGANGSRGEVDNHLTGRETNFTVLLMGTGTGRIKDDADIVPLRHGDKSVDPFMRGRNTKF